MEVGWGYKYILIFVTAVTLITLVAYMILGWKIANPTESQAKMLETLSTIAKGGVGTTTGMLIGKGKSA